MLKSQSIDCPIFLMVHSAEEPKDEKSDKVITVQLPVLPEYLTNNGWKSVIFARIDGHAISRLPADFHEFIEAYRTKREEELKIERWQLLNSKGLLS
ncbi:MAG: hypothetical protein ACK4V2_01130 [Pseudomonadota bacterium]